MRCFFCACVWYMVNSQIRTVFSCSVIQHASASLYVIELALVITAAQRNLDLNKATSATERNINHLTINSNPTCPMGSPVSRMLATVSPSTWAFYASIWNLSVGCVENSAMDQRRDASLVNLELRCRCRRGTNVIPSKGMKDPTNIGNHLWYNKWKTCPMKVQIFMNPVSGDRGATWLSTCLSM